MPMGGANFDTSYSSHLVCDCDEATHPPRFARKIAQPYHWPLLPNFDTLSGVALSYPAAFREREQFIMYKSNPRYGNSEDCT